MRRLWCLTAPWPVCLDRAARIAHPLLLAVLALALAGCATTSAQRSSKALERAERLRSQQKLAPAAKAYGDAWRHEPENLEALRGMVELHYRLGRTESLEMQLRDLVQREPANPYAHEALGLLLFAKGAGHGDEAIEHLSQAVKLAPDIADLNYRLGVALVESDRHQEALSPLSKAVELDSSTAKYRLPFAAALVATGAREKAIEQLGAVLNLDPEPSEVLKAEHTARALLDPFRGFPDSARESFEGALSWMDADAPAQAMEGFEALLERFPDLAIVQAMVGLCAAKMDDAGRAISAYRRAAEIDPTLAEPELFLADIYFNRGRPDTAIEHYRKAIALNPFLADAHGRLGESLRRLDRVPEAIVHFKTYTLIRPNDYEASLALATLLSDTRHPEGAKVWDRLYERYPSRSEVLVGRGRYYFVRAAEGSDVDDRRLSKRKSQESLNAAIRLDSNNTTATNLLRELRRLPF